MLPELRRAFLGAVLASPGDDVPRLIFADALDEDGDPLGEFIRVQCELAADNFRCSCIKGHGCKGCLPSRRAAALRRRERDLLALPIPPQVAAFAWSQPIHESGIALGRKWPDVFTFRRGFVEEITCTLNEWRLHEDAICAAAPIKMVSLMVGDENMSTFLLRARPGIVFNLIVPERLSWMTLNGARPTIHRPAR